jgi:hypothetical protein
VRVDLAKLVKEREADGQRLPALFCFPQILQHRLRSINASTAISSAFEPASSPSGSPELTSDSITRLCWLTLIG